MWKYRSHVGCLRRQGAHITLVSGGTGSELAEVNEPAMWRRRRRLVFKSGETDALMREEPEQEREREIHMDKEKEVWETKELSL